MLIAEEKTDTPSTLLPKSCPYHPERLRRPVKLTRIPKPKHHLRIWAVGKCHVWKILRCPQKASIQGGEFKAANVLDIMASCHWRNKRGRKVSDK